MLSIISLDTNPKHLLTLRGWCVDEWDKIDPFDSAVTAFENEKLVAGLIFSNYPMPGSEVPGLWINALLVSLEHRRKGIASRLIKVAEVEALRNKSAELYAYTHVPELYLKQNWVIVKDEGKYKVLKKLL